MGLDVDSLFTWFVGCYVLAVVVLVAWFGLAASLRPVAINATTLARVEREFGIALSPVKLDGRVLDAVASAATADGSVLYALYGRGRRLDLVENATGRRVRRIDHQRTS